MRDNDYVYCKDFRQKCWNWNKKKKKVSQEGVVSFKLNKKELKQYLEELETKEVKRIK